LVASCATEYDDTAVWDEFNKYNERLTKLEQLYQQMNTNISALQAIVTALQNNDYVTSVVPINQNGVEVGYVITFSKSGTITIYHGKDGKGGANGTDGKDGQNGADGKDGYTPQIGVKKDCDNIYYWTLDGQWLLDEAGNKIKAQDTDGKDGDNGANGKDGQNGACAFRGCASLGSIVIPDSVTSIGGSAFEQCGSLASITISAGVIDIHDAAFRYCYFLKDIYCRAITPPTLHGANTFEGFGSSATIYVPRPCVDLYKNAQGWSNYAGQIEGYDYESFTSVQILYTTTDGNIVEPSNLRGILSNTYENGQGVITIAGYENLLPINKFVFNGCNLLKAITILDGVTSIERCAFQNCSSLTSITIPDSVTEIGNNAFCACSSLAEVYCKPTTPPTGDRNMFYSNATGRKIYVPASSVDAYKVANGWQDYADTIEPYNF